MGIDWSAALQSIPVPNPQSQVIYLVLHFWGPRGSTGGRGGNGTAVSGARWRGGDGGGAGDGNDLGGGLGEELVQGLRPGRRNVGLGVNV